MNIYKFVIVIGVISRHWTFGKCHFLGGTISWVQFPKGVRFTYRLTWQKGTGPCGTNCSQHSLYNMGSLPSLHNALSWICTNGCAGHQVLHDVNYVVTSLSYNMSGWEQGENIFFHNFGGIGHYEITLAGLDWLVPGGSGKLVTTVDLGLRNDTGIPMHPNSSPVAALQPLVGIQYGCTTKVELPVEDPDGDSLKCRLAINTECGNACTNLPVAGLTVNENECSLTIQATQANGYLANHDYRVTLTVQDYPDYTIKVGNDIRSIRRPISMIPLQFTLKTISDTRPCSSKDVSFTKPTVPDGFRFSYGGPTLGIFKYAVYMETKIVNTDFMVSAPAGMQYQVLDDDNNRTNVQRVYFSMTPTPNNQSADSMVCVWGQEHNGLTTTAKRCITSIMYDFDECKGVKPCKNNGTCINLYRRWTCKCPHGYKSQDCSARVTCADFPCRNNGSCADTGVSYTCHCMSGFGGLDCESKYLTTTISSVTTHVLTSTTDNEIGINLDVNLSRPWTYVVAVFGVLISLVGVISCFWWCSSADLMYGNHISKVKPIHDLNKPCANLDNREGYKFGMIYNNATERISQPLPRKGKGSRIINVHSAITNRQ